MEKKKKNNIKNKWNGSVLQQGYLKLTFISFFKKHFKPSDTNKMQINEVSDIFFTHVFSEKKLEKEDLKYLLNKSRRDIMDLFSTVGYSETTLEVEVTLFSFFLFFLFFKFQYQVS